MTTQERKQFKFLKRMALAYLIYLQAVEKTNTFEPTCDVPNLATEYEEIRKTIIEIDTNLCLTN